MRRVASVTRGWSAARLAGGEQGARAQLGDRGAEQAKQLGGLHHVVDPADRAAVGGQEDDGGERAGLVAAATLGAGGVVVGYVELERHEVRGDQVVDVGGGKRQLELARSEEHTSELQSRVDIS